MMAQDRNTSFQRMWLILALATLVGCQQQAAQQPIEGRGGGATDEESPGSAPQQDKLRLGTESDESKSATLSDEQCRKLILGTWEDDYKGHRTLTIRSDGTATMVVELKGLTAKLYASRMTFEEEWSIEGGQLKLKTVSGEPEGRVNLILKTMGNVTVQEILELTEDRMVLLDSDAATKFEWRRVPADS